MRLMDMFGDTQHLDLEEKIFDQRFRSPPLILGYAGSGLRRLFRPVSGD